MLRPVAASGHRPFGRSGDRAAADRCPREGDADVARTNAATCSCTWSAGSGRWSITSPSTGCRKSFRARTIRAAPPGFGMGLVMALGPQIISTGGKSALKTCVALPTRWREFTCVHSLGHALMRGYHETLFLAVHACSRLGARYAPDCEQGAFHDYWISLRGADDATSPMHAVRSPRKLCAQYARYAVQCWYRYWIEQAPGPVIYGARDLAAPLPRACRDAARGLYRRCREGCVRHAVRAAGDVRQASRRSGCARMCARRRESGVCRATEAGAGVARRLPAAGGRRRRGLRSVVRADVQRHGERTVSRARVPEGGAVAACGLRGRGPALARAARDVLLAVSDSLTGERVFV